jgi:hypothetical protein
MRDHPGLYIIQEPEARNVPRFLSPPASQARESAWRTFLRWLAKHRRLREASRRGAPAESE